MENHVTRAGSGGNDRESILLLGNYDLYYGYALMRQTGCKHAGQLVGISCAHAQRVDTADASRR